MTELRALVCGGRNYHNEARVFKELSGRGITTIIQGGARGADKLASLWAKAEGLEDLQFDAEWTRYGRAAGAIRNSQMLKEGKPDIVIAFPGGRGTADMVDKAERAGVDVFLIDRGESNDPAHKG